MNYINLKVYYPHKGDDEHYTFVQQGETYYKFYFDGSDGYFGNTTYKEVDGLLRFLGFQVAVELINNKITDGVVTTYR